MNITCIQSNFLTRTIKEKGTYQSLSSVISRKEPRVRHPCRVAVRSKPWAYAGTCDLAHHISDRMRELPKTNSSATGEPSYGYHGIITFTRSPRIPKVEIVLIVCGSLYWGLMNDKYLNDTSKLVRWHPTDQNSAKTGLWSFSTCKDDNAWGQTTYLASWNISQCLCNAALFSTAAIPKNYHYLSFTAKSLTEGNI